MVLPWYRRPTYRRCHVTRTDLWRSGSSASPPAPARPAGRRRRPTPRSATASPTRRRRGRCAVREGVLADGLRVECISSSFQMTAYLVPGHFSPYREGAPDRQRPRRRRLLQSCDAGLLYWPTYLLPSAVVMVPMDDLPQDTCRPSTGRRTRRRRSRRSMRPLRVACCRPTAEALQFLDDWNSRPEPSARGAVHVIPTIIGVRRLPTIFFVIIRSFGAFAAPERLRVHGHAQRVSTSAQDPNDACVPRMGVSCRRRAPRGNASGPGEAFDPLARSMRGSASTSASASRSSCCPSCPLTSSPSAAAYDAVRAAPVDERSATG